MIVAVNVRVGVREGVNVNVLVGGTGVRVNVEVGLGVLVSVAVLVNVCVGRGVNVNVGVRVGVADGIGVALGVTDGVQVPVGVGVGVREGRGVNVTVGPAGLPVNVNLPLASHPLPAKNCTSYSPASMSYECSGSQTEKARPRSPAFQMRLSKCTSAPSRSHSAVHCAPGVMSR